MFNNKISSKVTIKTLYSRQTSSGEVVRQKLILGVEYEQYKPLTPEILLVCVHYLISAVSSSTSKLFLIHCCRLKS